jgi:hypothetical protein
MALGIFALTGDDEAASLKKDQNLTHIDGQRKPEPNLHRVMPECWGLVSHYCSFNDVRSLLAATVLSVDAQQFLKIQTRRDRFEKAIKAATDWLTLSDIRNAVEALVCTAHDEQLGRILSEASLRIMTRRRRRRPPEACPCCFERTR